MNGSALARQVLISVVAAVVTSWLIAHSPQLRALIKPAGARCDCGG